MKTASPIDGSKRRRIEKHWPRWRWTPEGASRWDQFDLRYYLTVAAIALLFATTLIEVAMFGGESPFLSFVQSLSAHPWVGFVLAVGSGWALFRILVWKRHSANRLSLGHRVSLVLVAGIPAFGLLLLPSWRANANEPPVPAAAPLALDRPARWRRRRLAIDLWLHRRAQHLPWLIAWMLAGQVIPWLTLVEWATRPAALRTHWGLQIALLVPMHLATAACGLLYARLEVAARQLVGWRAKLLAWLPLTFLLPLPMNLVGGHVWRRRSFDSLGAKSLFETIAAGPRTEAPRAADGTEGGGEFGPFGRHWRRFAELKVALLAADGALVGALLGRVGIEILAPWSFVLLYGAFAALSLGPIFAAGRFAPWGLARFKNYDAPVRPPFPFAISVGPASFGLGGYLGWLFVAEGAAKAGRMLALVIPAIVALILIGVLALFSAQMTKRTLDLDFGRGFLWLAGLQILAVIALLSIRIPGVARLLAGMFLASPLAHLVLGSRALPWLLHPLGWKGVFDRRMPGALRRSLAGRAATALLPFGGLVLPFWLHRRGHRARGDASVWWHRIVHPGP